MRVLLLVASLLLACGKKSSPPTHDDAAPAQPVVTAPQAPALPPQEGSGEAAPIDASIATHITPGPPPSTKFGHFCVTLSSGRSKCVMTEEECKRLAPRCGEWKSVFCYATSAGATCFSKTEDCKAAHAEAVKAGEQVTGDCMQDEM
jgi:hypothetical protein